jgi:hypothetical protein
MPEVRCECKDCIFIKSDENENKPGICTQSVVYIMMSHGEIFCSGYTTKLESETQIETSSKAPDREDVANERMEKEQ